MKAWVAALLVSGVLLGCGKKAASVAIDPVAVQPPGEAVDAVEAPRIGRLYSRVIDQARKEITAENARARLAELEREIEADEGQAP